MNKQELLESMFMEYWQWDILPTIPDGSGNPQPPLNSPEYFVLKMYDNKKALALSKYPWRSAIKYVDIVPIQSVGGDGRYKHSSVVPTDFVLATGFWQDSERRQDAHNDVDIVGKTARTNLKKFTMGYINKDIDEEDLDLWVCEYLKIFIASELSDLGGQTPDRKNYLLQKAEIDLIKLGNKDYEMSQKDEVSSSIHQFEWS